MYVYGHFRKDQMTGIDIISLHHTGKYRKSFVGMFEQNLLTLIPQEFIDNVPDDSDYYKRLTIDSLMEVLLSQEFVGNLPSDRVKNFIIQELI